MPLDVEKALSAPPVRTEVVWDERDVRLYHLALGAGVPETDPRELRYVYEGHERGLQVLPTFGVVAGGTGGVGFQVFDLPGVDIGLANVLHGGQEITVHRPLPVAARATAVTRATAAHDKGRAAVIHGRGPRGRAGPHRRADHRAMTRRPGRGTARPGRRPTRGPSAGQVLSRPGRTR
ncbi:hypothetical protein ACFY8X_12395 [Streptomyces tanashiensis]|uniref:hypothetical protein n=1 Tax=Streptomyces tanashiensis TaxID=67367 RepID=UPI0036DFF6A0